MEGTTETLTIIKDYEFSGVRIEHEYLQSLKWKVEFSIVPNMQSDDDNSTASRIALNKLDFWISTCLHNAIFASVESAVGVELSYSSSNSVFLTPYYPTDSHLAQLLHAKLSTIAGDAIDIASLSIKSTDASKTTYVYDPGYPAKSYSLPDSSYIEDNYFEVPWWFRNSFDTADYTNEEILENATLKEQTKCNVESLVEYEEKLKECFDESQVNDDDSEAEIIKVSTKWNPKVV